MSSVLRSCAIVLLAVGLLSGLNASLAAGPAMAIAGAPTAPAVVTAPAVADGPAVAAGGTVNPPPVNPPPGGGQTGGGQTGGGSCSGGTCSATVAETITLSGDHNSVYNDSWTPPECWLQPDFKQPQTYVAGDPSGGQTDADSYWFWFGEHYQGFGQFLYGTGATPQVNQEFQQEQNKQRPAAWTGPDPIESDDVWWVPNWLDSAAGWACAQGMVGADNLSDGFLGMEPPTPPGSPNTLGMITNTDLAGLARAALQLPTMTVVTSPPVSTEVNLPTYVSVVYGGAINPSDTATVELAGAPYLSATVQATLSNVQITSNAPSYHTTGAGDQGQACAAVNGKATTACSITFGAPSGATPYTIMVSATWTVTWNTSAGDGGTFQGITLPPATGNVVVREIQSQT